MRGRQPPVGRLPVAPHHSLKQLHSGLGAPGGQLLLVKSYPAELVVPVAMVPMAAVSLVPMVRYSWNWQAGETLKQSGFS